MTPVLQLEGVVKKYRRGDEQMHVLIDFDFSLDAGEFVVVTGPSGAGKSTLLHIAGGLDAPDTGTVAVAGQDVWAMSAGVRGVPAARFVLGIRPAAPRRVARSVCRPARLGRDRPGLEMDNP